MRAKDPKLRMGSGLSASPAEGKRGTHGPSPPRRRLYSQPKERLPLSWLHFVETRPLVGQPEFVFMQLQSSDASFMEHAAGTFLQELGVHAFALES